MKATFGQSRSSGKAKLGLLAAVALAAVGTTSELHAQITSVNSVPAGKYTGGGFIESQADPEQKATFGLNLEAVDDNDDGLIDRIDEIVEIPNPWPGFPPRRVIYTWRVGKGQFQFNDHGAGVKFHLDHDASYELNPDNSLPERVEVRSMTVFDPTVRPFPFRTTVLGMDWVGTYRSDDGTGTVKVSLNAEEDPFGSLVDRITVRVQSGPYAGYIKSGVVKGGNIKWHPAQ